MIDARRSRDMSKTIKIALRYLPLLILVFFFTFPLIFMIVSSFKGSRSGDLRFAPSCRWATTMANYERVFG
jgi:ABC-type glycerol-3-phosphate transport system permease component